MQKLERPTVEKAFAAGYHSEKLNGASHTVHNLGKDASVIAAALPIQREGLERDIRDSLLYGVDIRPYEDADRVFGSFATRGDKIFIWTQGDPQGQVAKVRNLGWEQALRKPDDPANFILYAAQDKVALLPRIIQFSQREDSDHNVFILDDSLKNLEDAKMELDQHEKPRKIHYVWINRDGNWRDTLPTHITTVNTLTEYREYVDRIRNGDPVVHIADLDGTIIDPKQTETSRRKAVIAAITERVVFSKKQRPRYKQFNGFYILDDGKSVKLTDGSDIPLVESNGYHTEIWRIKNEYLAKAFVLDGKNRPTTRSWQELGGYRGVLQLMQSMQEYRRRLSEVGFPVPQDAQFMIARNKDGTFFPIEIVKDYGQSMADVFIKETDSEKLRATSEILETSYPLFMAKDIGADVKPANFVKDSQGNMTHIDPFPVIMRDETTGEVSTEWPRIETAEIQEFLYRTHITPLAIGYRFYQELCQIDVGMRSMYRQQIEGVLNEWQKAGRIPHDLVDSIHQAMYQSTSQYLDQILEGKIDQNSGFEEIEKDIKAHADRNEHPIYALREMGFLLSEFLLKNGYNMDTVVTMALDYIASQLDSQDVDNITNAVTNVPTHLRLLTLIRKLTHLSHTSSKPGRKEIVAYNVIKHITEQIHNL